MENTMKATLILSLLIISIYAFANKPGTLAEMKNTLSNGSWYHEPKRTGQLRWQVNFFKDGKYKSTSIKERVKDWPRNQKGKWSLKKEGSKVILILEKGHPLNEKEILFSNSKEFQIVDSKTKKIFKKKKFDRIQSDEERIEFADSKGLSRPVDRKVIEQKRK